MKSLQCLNNGGGFFIFVFVCCKLSFQMKFTLLPAKKTQEEKKNQRIRNNLWGKFGY